MNGGGHGARPCETARLLARTRAVGTAVSILETRHAHRALLLPPLFVVGHRLDAHLVVASFAVVLNPLGYIGNGTSPVLLEYLDGSVLPQIPALWHTAQVDAEAGLAAVLASRPEALQVTRSLLLKWLLTRLTAAFLLLVARLLSLRELLDEEGKCIFVWSEVHQLVLLGTRALPYHIPDFFHGLAANQTLLGTRTHAQAHSFVLFLFILKNIF